MRPLLAIVVVAACTSSPSAPGNGAGAGPDTVESGPALPAPAQPDPAATPDPCASAVTEYERLLAEAPPMCGNDDQCSCYNGGVSSKASCGGVAHGTKAKQLEAVRSRHLAAGCRSGIQCAAWSCQPVCRNGSCVNGP